MSAQCPSAFQGCLALRLTFEAFSVRVFLAFFVVGKWLNLGEVRNE